MSIIRRKILLWLLLFAATVPAMAQESVDWNRDSSFCKECGSLNVLANLLRWATLTPDGRKIIR